MNKTHSYLLDKALLIIFLYKTPGSELQIFSVTYSVEFNICSHVSPVSLVTVFTT